MRLLFLKNIILNAIVIVIIHACKEEKNETRSFSTASYEMDNTDTINLIDHNKLKQGKWVVKDYSHQPPVLIESGNYKDNLKQGVWHYYDSSGIINRSVNYLNDLPTKN